MKVKGNEIPFGYVVAWILRPASPYGKHVGAAPTRPFSRFIVSENDSRLLCDYKWIASTFYAVISTAVLENSSLLATGFRTKGNENFDTASLSTILPRLDTVAPLANLLLALVLSLATFKSSWNQLCPNIRTFTTLKILRRSSLKQANTVPRKFSYL